MPPIQPMAEWGALAGSALARNRMNSDQAAWYQTAFSAINRPLHMELWLTSTSSPGGQRQPVTPSERNKGENSEASRHDTADTTH